mmetsp:Transcript_8126/g.25845  ORF Transcript_8126/g.25845 Transcript_8126/m.25845 type:complete len:81 (+) Transcript_8126:204-446(+)
MLDRTFNWQALKLKLPPFKLGTELDTLTQARNFASTFPEVGNGLRASAPPRPTKQTATQEQRRSPRRKKQTFARANPVLT